MSSDIFNVFASFVAIQYLKTFPLIHVSWNNSKICCHLELTKSSIS